MSSEELRIIPVKAPVKTVPFDLHHTLLHALQDAQLTLQEGDILAISSKYVAISEGRVVELDTVQPGTRAIDIAKRYNMDPKFTQLIVDEADHIFGGIPLGYLLTWRCGIMSPNAGLDRSNIPAGQVVLLPAEPYKSAHHIQNALQQAAQVNVGIIIMDSWLMPGRWGTTGIALATAGFAPIEDVRGKKDLFGTPLKVTKRGVADSMCAAAQLVMGETDEATPMVLIRNAGVEMSDKPVTVDDVAIPWKYCIYIESLTVGLLDDEDARQDMSRAAYLAQAPE